MLNIFFSLRNSSFLPETPHLRVCASVHARVPMYVTCAPQEYAYACTRVHGRVVCLCVPMHVCVPQCI